MPASADIYASLATPGKGTGLATMGELADLKAIREQRQAAAQKAQADAAKAQKDQARQALIQATVQKHMRPDGTLARTAALDEVMGIDLDAGQQLSKILSTIDTDASNARKAELDNEDKSWSQTARLLQPLNEKNAAALLPSVKARVRAYDPEMADLIPDTYDPERLKAIVGMGTSRAEYNQQYKDILSEKKDALTTAVKLLSIAKTPEHVQDAFEFAGHHDITDKLTELGFSPDAPDVAERATAFIQGPQKESTKAPPDIGSFSDYVVRKYGPTPTAAQIEQGRQKYAEEARAPQITVNTGAPEPLLIDPGSQNILSQTGLSINAFRLLTGMGSQLPRDQATRNRAANEAQTWARAHNVDISTLPSQYKTYNDVLSNNISRLNNTKIMESELQGTIDNLKTVAKDADLGRLNIANVAKIWAGQEVNDSLAQQYALHLSQLRNELSAYYAATQGRTGNNITLQDQRDAELVLKNGLSAGSLNGLQKAIENSTAKMGTVLQGSVERAQKQVWNLFGVGGNYKGGGGDSAAPKTAVPDTVKSALSSKGAGEYDLSDGHTYRKDASGSISVVK